MQCRFGAGMFLFVFVLSTASAVWADPVTFQFDGRVDTATGVVPPSIGDVLFGSVTFDIPGTEAPPGASSGFFQTRQDVFHLSFAHDLASAPFNERTLHSQLFTIDTFNDFAGVDELGITLSTFTFPQFNFHIDLIDNTATALPNANLPASPNFAAFQVRNFVGSIEIRQGGGQAVVGTLGGTLTSLFGGQVRRSFLSLAPCCSWGRRGSPSSDARGSNGDRARAD